MLQTLKQKDQAILSNARAIFTVKSVRNNGGSGPNTRLCTRDEREEEGEDGCSLLCCRLIILARTDSDRAQSLSALGLNRQ